MSKYDDILTLGLDTIIDTIIDPLICEDEVYTQNMEDADGKLDLLNLTDIQRELLDDIIANLMCANQRACNISFLCGVKSGIEFLKWVINKIEICIMYGGGTYGQIEIQFELTDFCTIFDKAICLDEMGCF